MPRRMGGIVADRGNP